MLSRIGDFAQSERMTATLLQTQTRTRLTQAQIGTGKVTDRFQDLAPEVERLIDVKVVLEQNRQFQENNNFTDQKLRAMEGAVSGLFEIATKLQTLTIQRLNDGTVDPGTLGPEFEGLLDQAVALLNSDLDGRHLFGGSKTDQSPVVLDPAFTAFGSADGTYYRGDDLVLSVRADVDIEITTTMSADREGFRDLIGALRGVINGDVLDDRDVLENSLGLVKESLGKISEYQAELGIHQAQLEQINQRHVDTEIYLENRISEIEDVDLTEAITRLAQDQILLESAMATLGRLNQLSLVDYI